MATNDAGRRYRTCYAMLLRMYPRPFRERFGEGMAQTFNDLCRECRDPGLGLFGFAVWIFFETSVGIVRENTTHMPQILKTMLRVALGALAALMVPLVASQFVEDWHWGAGGFVFAGGGDGSGRSPVRSSVESDPRSALLRRPDNGSCRQQRGRSPGPRASRAPGPLDRQRNPVTTAFLTVRRAPAPETVRGLVSFGVLKIHM